MSFPNNLIIHHSAVRSGRYSRKMLTFRGLSIPENPPRGQTVLFSETSQKTKNRTAPSQTRQASVSMLNTKVHHGIIRKRQVWRLEGSPGEGTQHASMV